MWKFMASSFEPLVSVCVISYNQENFIKTCLDGILSQKTNFSFELLISDDASTDKTQTLVKEYEEAFPTIIRNISKEKNVGSVENFYTTMNDAKGRYIALCEGDDFWIDTNKLQNQIDFLENNPEIGMCYARAKLFHNKKQRYYSKPTGSLVSSFDDLFINGSRIPTLTSCFRKNLYEQYIKEINPVAKGWLLGDLPMWLWFYYNSKVYFSRNIVAVYRKLEDSVSHSKDFEKQKRFDRSCFAVRSFYKTHYNLHLPLEWNEDAVNVQIAFHQFNREKILNSSFKNLETKEKLVWVLAHSKILFFLTKKLYIIIKGGF